MNVILSLFRSTVGRKIITAIAGLTLFSFVVMHLLGNLTLLTGKADTFNAYSHFLVSFGGLLIVAEIGLLAFFVLHFSTAFYVWLENRKARPVTYTMTADAGGPSHKTLSSRTMIITGPVILTFVILHVWMFKYGPGVKEGYVTKVGGVEMRDLHRLVMEAFSNTSIVVGYVAAMLFLGFHLRHAFWSAFQSLGVHHPRYTPVIYALGVLLAIAIATGFLVLPLWIFFTGGRA